MTDMATNSAELSQLASEIQSRIANLESLFEDSLNGEMDALKAVLIENPSAAALLKDEDVGLLVANLKRTVQKDIQDAIAGKTKKASAKSKTKLSAAQIEAALAEEGL